MTLLFAEGFENADYSVESDVHRRGWHGFNVNNTQISVPGRWGTGQAIEYTNVNSRLIHTVPVTTPSNEICVSFAFRHQGFLSGVSTNLNGVSLLGILTDTDSLNVPSVNFLYVGGSLIVARRASNLSLLTPVAGIPDGPWLKPNTWHWLDFRCVVSNTVGELEFYLDGEQMYSFTGLDTQNTASSVIAGVMTRGLIPQMRDSMVVYDTSGTSFNTFPLGDTEMEVLRPVSNGFQTDFLPLVGPGNFEDVDSPLPSPAREVSASTVGSIDSYGMSSLSKPYSNVLGVSTETNVYIDGASSSMKTLRSRVRSAGSDYLGAPQGLKPNASFTDDAVFMYDFTDADPNGSVPWTAASVNAMEVGFEVVT